MYIESSRTTTAHPHAFVTYYPMGRQRHAGMNPMARCVGVYSFQCLTPTGTSMMVSCVIVAYS